jgi:hypothetical protein
MKKTLFVILLCAVLLSMPTLLAFQTSNRPSPNFSPLKMSDGTFAGGLGSGHWGNGFHIDTVFAYMSGVYSSGTFLRILGTINNPDDEKIGEIRAFILSKILFGYTRDTQGQMSPIFGFLVERRSSEFSGRIIFSTYKSAPHFWGYMIPNT